MLQTNTADIRLTDGVVVARIRAGASQSIEDAEENLAATLRATEGQRRPLLVDIRGAQPLEAEVRHHYTGQMLVDGFSALAMLVDASPLGVMMGNVYLRVARPGIPTKLSSDEARALEWLRTYR